jgi:hypothetical protein
VASTFLRVGGEGYFLAGKRALNGYLDRMRKNIQVLDESIESVSMAPRNEKPAERRARLKLLRDFVELQNATLVATKTHLLGRDETGAPIEPPDHYDHNDQIEFERYFKNQPSPWTEDDLKLECETAVSRVRMSTLAAALTYATSAIRKDKRQTRSLNAKYVI